MPGKSGLGLPWATITDRLLMLAALATAVVLAIMTFSFIWYFARHAGYHFGLDYGEGPILYQFAVLSAGQSIYQPITEAPYAVSNYPPVFHAVTWLVNLIVDDPLLSGRLVSFLAALASGLLVATLVGGVLHGSHPKRVRLVAAVLAGMFFLSHVVVSTWATMMRVDTLALAFSLLGMQFFVLSLRRPVFAWICGLAFLLAVFTKPNMIAAAAASIAAGFVIARPQALRIFAVCVAGGAVALGLLVVATDGEFPRHVFFYNANEFQLPLLRRHLSQALTWGTVDITVLAGTALLFLAWLRRRIVDGRQPGEHDPALLLFGWFLGVSLINVIGAGKVGSSHNYFMEFVAATSLLAGSLAVRLGALSRCTEWGGDCFRIRLLAVIGLGLICWQATLGWNVKFGQSPWLAEEQSQRLAERVAGAKGAVITEDMVLTYRAGLPLYFQPFIMTQLAAEGRWSVDPVLQAVRLGEVSFVVLYSDFDSDYHLERFPPGLREALESRYRLEGRYAFYRLYVPR